MDIMRSRAGTIIYRAATWVAVLVLFVVLLVLANTFTEGERFHGLSTAGVIAVTLAGLLALFRATRGNGAWEVSVRGIGWMTLGAVLYAAFTYFFGVVVDVSIGQVQLRPAICIPVLFGYAFGPVVGFFTGAVGSVLGDFISGWGVFPNWAMGSGLTGMVPGLVVLVAKERHNLRTLTTVILVLIVLTAGVVFVHPHAPEPWTDEVVDHSFWGWALLIGGLVMVANRFLLEDRSVALAAVNLWGTLGILAGNAYAALADIWISEFTPGTAIIAAFAPAAASDLLNLMVFTPLVLAAYNLLRRKLGEREVHGQDT